MLEVGALTETITVQSERTLLQTDTGDLHTIIESEEISALPMGNYRNYETLLNLVPGTTPGRLQNAITDTPARSLSNNVNGTNRNSNNTKLDGATNIFVWLPHHAAYIAPAETVETVNIATANFDAEQGMSGGAAIRVMTKSGTNEFHGAGTYLFENDGLRARNFFNQGEKPESKRQIGAVTLGGPIIKDKLFFFGGWEGHHLLGSTTRTGTVATPEMRRGDFSAFDTIIYDPRTGNPDGTGRTPFPGNMIPADRIHPTSTMINDRTPLPTADGTSSNYNNTGNFNLDRNNYDFKVNWNVNNSLMIWGKYSQMNAVVDSDMWLGNPDEGGIGGSAWGSGSGPCDTKVKIPTIGFTWTASPTFVVDGVAANMRFDQECLPPDLGVSYGLDVFNIPGTNGGSRPLDADDPRYQGLLEFRISGCSGLGGVDGWNPIFRNDRTKNLAINATWIKNNHEFRFGFNVVNLELTHWQPEIANPRGDFEFRDGITSLNGGPSGNSLNAYAGFLLGEVQRVRKSIQYDLLTGREWQYGFFARDRWQVNRNLTLTLGLRFEVYPFMVRENRGTEEYDPTTNLLNLCGKGGIPDDCGFECNKPGILPRLGFAYRLGEDNVIRGGFGRSANPLAMSRPLRGRYPITVANTFEAANNFSAVTNFTEGIPMFDGPDRSLSQVVPGLSSSVRTPMGSFTRGYIDSWNLIFERRLPRDMSLSAGYVGTRTVDQLRSYNINTAAPGEGSLGRPLNAAFGRTGTTQEFTGGLRAEYHSLQMALNKPFAGTLHQGRLHLVEGHERGRRRRRLAGLGPPRCLVQELRPGGLRPHSRPAARLRVGDALWPRRRGRPQRDHQGLVGERYLRRLLRQHVHGRHFELLLCLSGEPAVGGPDQRPRQAGRRRPRPTLLRPERVGGNQRGPLRQHGPQLDPRTGRDQLRSWALPPVPHRLPGQLGASGRGVQPHEHAALRQPGEHRNRRRLHGNRQRKRPRRRIRAPDSVGSSLGLLI